MQTILGATGVIGNELAKCLPQYTDKVRLVSRNLKTVLGNEELVSADLLDAAATSKAIEESEVAYLTAGLRYNIKTWQQQWPVIMRNVIEGCKKYHCRLVFFDNVYAYGKVNGWMKEDTPYNPSSKKGMVRRQIAEMLMNEVKAGSLQAMIVRAADFYGPNTEMSFFNVMVFANYAKSKSAQYLLRDDVKHSFTYTPDAGAATALLGNTITAFNQVWHLPTDMQVLTGKEMLELSAAAMGTAPKYMVMKKWLLRIVGLFMEPIRESIEMLYQNDSDYLFDSSKFEKEFGQKATPYPEGIKATASYYMQKK